MPLDLHSKVEESMLPIYILFILVITLILLFLILNRLIKHRLQQVIPKITKTTFQLKHSNIFLLPAKGSLSVIIMGNPQGFKTASSFEMKTIQVSLKLLSVISNKIIIERIEIKDPSITYEMNGVDNNLKTILDNVKAYSASQNGKDQAEEKPEKESKKVQINNFIITNGSINLSISQLEGKKLPVPMPNIELKDIGKESDGKSISEVLEEILSIINKDIINIVSKSSDPALKATSFAKDVLKNI